MFKGKRGFTLIELLVVIAIIGILTGIIVTNLTSSKTKANDARRISDLGHIQFALELYYDKCKQYPTASSGAVNGSASNCTGTTASMTDYISKIPSGPNSGEIYNYVVNNASKPTSYVLQTTLQNTNPEQENSFPQSVWSAQSWYVSTYPCHNVSTDKYYCVSSK